MTNGAINIPSNPTISNIMSSNSNEIYASRPIDAKLYEYDSKGKLSKAIAGNGMSAQYGYDVFGRLSDVRDTNGHTVKRYEYKYGKQPNSKITRELSRCKLSIYKKPNTPPKQFFIGYELPYYASSAKMLVIDRIGLTIGTWNLPTDIKTGERKIRIEDRFQPPYRIMLHVNGSIESILEYHTTNQ